ncbi:secreted RxLR effector protein 161-like [Primulina eburnea]|uniref:secreted RxLR effector protein 161-like n=1 Tax=Primulina eburnea TaxID=1245227 RepID=UPI003C6C0402
MSSSKSVLTSLAQHFKLTASHKPETSEERNYMTNVPYASVVGSVMYAMICTRPDLAYAVSMVSRFMANPGKTHWEALKWVMRYLKGTVRYRLVYGRANEITEALNGFVDSDFARCIDTRKSITGYVFTMFGTTISWKVSLQPVVALSTTEAEYIAITEGVKEAMCLRGLVAELEIQDATLRLLCDNQSAIHLTKNQVFHERTKHVGVKLHFVREVVGKGEVELEKVKTDDNVAGMLTKPITKDKLLYCLKMINVEELEGP